MFEKGKPVSGGSSSHAAETIVGSSVKLKGNLRSDGNIKIYGAVAGELKTKGSVYVGPEASIVATIKAKSVKVSGTVQGNIDATDLLEITESGRVLGDISANVLSIAPGAVFSGRSQMNDRGKEIVIEPIAEVDLPEKTEKPKEKVK